MPYHSLFDKIAGECPPGTMPQTFREFLHLQSYSGNLREVLGELEALCSYSRPDTKDLVIIALHAPRVIRAVLDFKISYPLRGNVDLVRNAIDLGLAVYGSDSQSVQHLHDFRSKIESQCPQLLERKVKQQEDTTTWSAMKPERSRATAEKMMDYFKNRDVLFITMAHGGTAPGMDVFLRYCDAGAPASSFYVVRLSMDKLRDRRPRILKHELGYLQEQTDGRRILIFDEDVCEGRTIRTAYDYFSHAFPHRRITLATNMDKFGERVEVGSRKKLLIKI
ncbi:MAG: hypothetical protein HYW26_04315 [Candidatus Aenigmarchaeota archaeon]|nr:hypothetical protein [Candidatus Aenigmarchaeota archaeon]